MNDLPVLELNNNLTEEDRKELLNFVDTDAYKKYRRGNGLKGIIPDLYVKSSPAMVADDGADVPINVLTKVLLDKQNRFKDGRNILYENLLMWESLTKSSKKKTGLYYYLRPKKSKKNLN